MTEKKITLFVDDDENILRGLKRMLHSMHNEWEMHFIDNGKAALDLMENTHVDVIVSDMRMPVMDGATLLSEVKLRHPQAARILLSGHSDEALILKAIMPTYQYLSKPCTPEMLKIAVARSCSLSSTLGNKGLQTLIAGMSSLPSLPRLYNELMEELESGSVSLPRVARIVTSDMGMTVKMLQLVNSSFFGIARSISDPVQAVTFLGFESIKALALTHSIFSSEKKCPTSHLSLEHLWQHSALVAALAKQIAVLEKASIDVCNQAFTAGLLHDIGKIILARNFTDKYADIMALVREEGLTELEAERQVLGGNHAQVGATLVSLWGLPTELVEAIAFHHSPAQCGVRTFIPLTAVHVANCFAGARTTNNTTTSRTPNSAATGDHTASMVDEQYLTDLGLHSRLCDWQASLAKQ